MRKAAILIVEDDDNILNANRVALELQGYRVLAAKTLSEARTVVESVSIDLVLLDILLPDGNGLAYCEELRGENGVRILFLSALRTKTDMLAGLRAGGDDYIAKPYDMDELILRVEALFRRGKMIGMEEPPQVLGRLTLNHTSRRALLDGCDLLLKPKEFMLLAILAGSPGKVISTAELYEKIWGMNMADNPQTVKEHISRIRNKLGDNSGFSIISVRGRGYRLDI